MKKYYVVYWSPVQVGAVYHTGRHPLLPAVLSAIKSKIVSGINICNGLTLSADSVTITWVTEMPAEPAIELVESRPKQLETATLFEGVCN
jgi:predicted oxidoreductase